MSRLTRGILLFVLLALIVVAFSFASADDAMAPIRNLSSGPGLSVAAIPDAPGWFSVLSSLVILAFIAWRRLRGGLDRDA